MHYWYNSMDLMAKINQKISSIGISIKISLGLMDQEVYSREDAVMDLIDAMESLNFEHDGLLNEIKKARKNDKYNCHSLCDQSILNEVIL